MEDYDPSEFRLNGAGILAAWFAVVVFAIVAVLTLSLTEPTGPNRQDRLTAETDQHLDYQHLERTGRPPSAAHFRDSRAKVRVVDDETGDVSEP